MANAMLNVKPVSGKTKLKNWVFSGRGQTGTDFEELLGGYSNVSIYPVE